MDELIMGVWAAAILISILGCVPYTIWIICIACKRRWRKLCAWLCIPFVLYLLLLGFTAVADSIARDQYPTGVYDTKVTLGDAVYEYESERAFNGDGYTFMVYRLPAAIKTRFEAADDKLLTKHPSKCSYRSEWRVQNWKAGPLRAEDQKYLDFALLGGDESLAVHAGAIRKALAGEGAYYAYLHYDHGGFPGNVDFFVVDLENDYLYVINFNT